MHVEPHHTPEQLAALIRAEPRAKVARRLTAVRLALLGQTAAAIAAQVLLAECAWRAVCLDPDKVKTVCRCGYANTGS
jgi:hypothetical protein